MALPLGKLTLIVGAGLVGSVLAKEGHTSGVSDFFSGAFKLVFRQLKKDDGKVARVKPPNDSLLAQIWNSCIEFGLVLDIARAYFSQLKFVHYMRSFTFGMSIAGFRHVDSWGVSEHWATGGAYVKVICDITGSRIGAGLIDREANVNSLREELQLLASNRPITIVTSTSDGRKYGAVVVVLVIGYVYVWWKGWKLPNLMFATRRSLSEATTKISKELENVYSSISLTKRHLSSKIDHVDASLDEAAKVTDATREEVTELRGDLRVVGGDVRSVRHAVQTLETKLSRIEGKQNYTVENVVKLVDFAWTLDNGRTNEHNNIQAIHSSPSMPALELPESTASPMNGSVTPKSTLEPPSPSASVESQKRSLPHAVSGSGLKDLHEPSGSPVATNGVHVTEETNQNNSSSSVFGRLHSGFTSAFISRTRSAMPSLK